MIDVPALPIVTRLSFFIGLEKNEIPQGYDIIAINKNVFFNSTSILMISQYMIMILIRASVTTQEKN